MKKLLITLLFVLFGLTVTSQNYDMKINRVCYFSYPANIEYIDYDLIDSAKYNETFVHFATVKIDFTNKLILCGEVTGLKTKTTIFNIVSVIDDDWTTLNIIGKNEETTIHFQLIGSMLVVSYKSEDMIYGWFDRVVEM